MTKIAIFIQGEAVRMTRKLPPRFTQRECDELLDSLKNCLNTKFTSSTINCFHGKPIVCDLYDMDDLPVSQYDTVLDSSCT